MSAEFVRNSMRHLPTEVRATKEKFRHENDLVIQAEIQKAIPIDQVQSLRTIADATPLPIEKAQWIAAAESTA